MIGHYEDKYFQVCAQLPLREKTELVAFLKDNMDVFAWSTYVWETAPLALFFGCWAKPTWVGGVMLLHLKMEVQLIIFSPLD